jgi:uncharacterized protein YcbK (DUF882 family)
MTYFSDKEFECKCGCGLYIPNLELLDVLSKAREYFKVPIIITSGTRCTANNKKVGGVDTSKHTTGEAADIQVKGIEPIKVYKYFTDTYFNKYGVGNYSTFTHIDVREEKARWGGK